jgi:hypothetical protein
VQSLTLITETHLYMGACRVYSTTLRLCHQASLLLLACTAAGRTGLQAHCEEDGVSRPDHLHAALPAVGVSVRC